MSECIFCKIVSGELPSYKVYEDEKVLAFMDIYPITKGHVLIIPKEHYKDLLSMDSSVGKEIIDVGQKIGSRIISKFGADGFNFSTNQGKAAGQEIFHVHFHIIPRKKGDKLINWPNHNSSKEELKKIAETISFL